MSSIFQSEKKQADFEKFKEEIINIYSNSQPDKSICDLPEFKKLHSLIYSIALIQIKVSNNETLICKYVFLKEIQSDLLLLLTHSLFGFYNTSMIIYRRVIENFYNHIFYYNHEIEFIHLNNGRNEYTPIIELKNYLTTYPVFTSSDKLIKEYNDYIFTEYTELNKFVHTKGINFMGLAKSLKELKKNINHKEMFNQINETAYRMIYILYKFHTTIKLKNVELKLITDCIPRDKRTSLTE